MNHFENTALVISEAYQSAMRNALLTSYYSGWNPDYLASEGGQAEIDEHVYKRMLEVEQTVIPWINQVYDISGKTVVEIGCGTGSATLPFALRTNQIDAYDISPGSIDAACVRVNLLGAGWVRFHLLDPEWAVSETVASDSLASHQSVDIVLMIALLEHLKIEERINIIKTAFEILRPGGIMIVYETPNRLNYFDWHTFLMPLVDCLPDQLLTRYVLKTPRQSMLDILKEDTSVEKLYRLGRGVSFHEFELALGGQEYWAINDGFSDQLSKIRKIEFPLYHRALLEIFNKYFPQIPPGFVLPSLDLIIQKGGVGFSHPHSELVSQNFTGRRLFDFLQTFQGDTPNPRKPSASKTAPAMWCGQFAATRKARLRRIIERLHLDWLFRKSRGFFNRMKNISSKIDLKK